MKKLNIIIVLLIQLNLVFLILNIFKDNNYNDKELLCFSKNDNEVAIVKIDLDDDYYVSSLTTYFGMLNKRNFKETLVYNTDFYKKDEYINVINNKLYFTNTNEYKDKLYLYEILEKYSDYRCSYTLKK